VAYSTEYRGWDSYNIPFKVFTNYLLETGRNVLYLWINAGDLTPKKL
jgi:hypothetical protein